MIRGEGLTAIGIVEAASIAVAPGELVVLLGPNGAGKTTLLQLLLGLRAADAGTTSVAGLSPAARARAVAYLPQVRPMAWPARVRDVVALGRYAYGAAPQRLGQADRGAIEAALAACDLGALADRAVDTLSGGELARVHLARALTTQAPLIVADEPVASLDPRHQLRVLDLLQLYVATGGGALVVLHDLALAARYATRLVWMLDGRIVADGTVGDTLTEERIAEVYGVASRVTPDGVVLDAAL